MNFSRDQPLIKYIALVPIILIIVSVAAAHTLGINSGDVARTAAAAFVVFCFIVDVRYGLIAMVLGLLAAHFMSTDKPAGTPVGKPVGKPLDKQFSGSVAGSVAGSVTERNGDEIAVETIPRTIVQIWIEKDPTKARGIPAKEQKYADRLRKMNPEFNYLFFDEKDVEPFFTKSYPEYYSTYKRLPLFIQKMDFFRYLILYHYGGFYFDMDVLPLAPLDESIRGHNAVFPVDEYIVGAMVNRPRFAPIVAQGQQFLIGQYAFGCVARHPFFKLAIDKIHANVETYITTVDSSEVYVYRTTGPDFITNLYANYENKAEIYVLDNGKRQMFGDYARHDYSGNWKIQLSD